jgi:maleate isomerase
MSACTAALRALGVQRILLMTPFDDEMNARLVANLAGRGFESVGNGKSFASPDDAVDLPPDAVFQLTMQALAEADRPQGIYFQGAVLDPIKVMDRLEAETGLPIVASNLAMLWSVLSQLGRSYSIQGFGRLVRDWPPFQTAR